jgi:hypothetical protein
MRANRSSRRLSAGRVIAVDDTGPSAPARAAAEEEASRELLNWRGRALPSAAPLDAEDLVRLLRECVAVLGLDPAIVGDFTVNTVHYYRRKDIIDPPDGRTAAARYGVRHLWQIAGARLAGYLGLVTLAEAKKAMRGMSESALVSFLAARIADARARDTLRARGTSAPAMLAARPLPGRRAASQRAAVAAIMISLPDDAWCVVPASHPAQSSPEAADALVRALADALRAR